MDQHPAFGDAPQSIKEVPSPNFCSIDLLKADFDSNRTSHSRPNEPVGIDEWHRTGRGDYLAKTALGHDPKDPLSEDKLDDWISMRSDSLDTELRQLYNLPPEASKVEVATAIRDDDRRGGRHCAMSQGLPMSDQVYEGITYDIITGELSDLYNSNARRDKDSNAKEGFPGDVNTGKSPDLYGSSARRDNDSNVSMGESGYLATGKSSDLYGSSARRDNDSPVYKGVSDDVASGKLSDFFGSNVRRDNDSH